MFPAALFENRTEPQARPNLVKVMVICPTTGNPTYTGSSINAEMLMDVEISHQLFLCQECKRPHQWGKQDILVNTLSA